MAVNQSQAVALGAASSGATVSAVAVWPPWEHAAYGLTGAIFIAAVLIVALLTRPDPPSRGEMGRAWAVTLLTCVAGALAAWVSTGLVIALGLALVARFLPDMATALTGLEAQAALPVGAVIGALAPQFALPGLELLKRWMARLARNNQDGGGNDG
jgi:hypothetical protein